MLDEDSDRRPRYQPLGALALILLATVLAVTWGLFRGTFKEVTPLTMLAARAGLVLETGTKVTYNGVAIGRVGSIDPDHTGELTRARLRLDVEPRYVELIPANVHADIKATTIFGNKYVALTAPPQPTERRITTADVIDATTVTTEFNTLFETVTSLSEKIDPVQLNATLTAMAEAFRGLGTKFGQSLVDGNAILADLNPRMPQIHRDVVAVPDLADVYTAASPTLWSFLDNAATTAQTVYDHSADLEDALRSAIGFGSTGADIFERAAPYLVRSAADLTTSARVLDRNSPALFCGTRNFARAAPAVRAALGDNGYSLATNTTVLGAENRYIWPDNLPRVNAKGGPGGRPGCWQEITRELWPAPWLVMDTGASIAPYNHFGLGQPIVTEYVWGRQVGEETINP